MWTTRNFVENQGLTVVDVSQEGHIIVLEGEGPLEEGDSILFRDSAFGVRYWDTDDLGNRVEARNASYRVNSVEFNDDGISWIACASHFPRVMVEALPPEM